MKFREHRGGLDEAMQTVVELPNFDALVERIRQSLADWPTAPPVMRETVHVQPIGYDDRIDWDTYLITLDGYGVVGYTNELPRDG